MISVVIPVRNRAGLVKRTLDSIDAQTLKPDAIILVDNGSTDSTAEVLRSWAAGRPEVKVISEPAPGAPAARNAGLALVETPYVMFFDSDDEMPPGHIQEVTAALQGAGLPDILEFPSEFIKADGRRKTSPLRTGDSLKNQIFHSTLATQRYCAKTDLVRRVGAWDTELPAWNDLELGVRLLAAKPRLVQTRLSQPVRIHLHSDSITGADFSSKAGQWELALDHCERDLDALPRYKAFINYRRAILAGKYMSEGHPELARGLVSGRWMKLIAAYVARGGRGVAQLAKVENFR